MEIGVIIFIAFLGILLALFIIWAKKDAETLKGGKKK